MFSRARSLSSPTLGAALAALVLSSNPLGAGPLSKPGERDERVAHQRPLKVKLRELPPSKRPALSGPPRSHIQGEPGPVAERGGSARPLPSGAAKPAAAAVPEDRDPATNPQRSTITLTKDAIDYTGWFPPDAVLAASSSFILAAVNDEIAVYDSSGVEVLGGVSFTDFFAGHEPAGWQGFYFDPRVAYVMAEGQFLLLALGRDDVAQSSYAFLAVSETSDPSGDWWVYRYRADKGADVDSWLDFPGLAGDEWGVYFTGNYFDNNGAGFQHATIWSINPAVYTGGASNGNKKSGITWPSTGAQAFAIQPAVPHSSASGDETFFAATHTGSGDEVLLMTMTGDRTLAPPLAKDEVAIQDYDQIGPNVDQPGSSADLDGGDCRVGNAVYAQRRVYLALSTDPDNNGARGGVITAKINVDTAAVEWESLTASAVDDPLYYFYPAVTIGSGASSTPRIAWFGTWSGASQNPSTVYRLFDSGAAHPPVEFISTKTGLSDYELLDNGNRNRWGDYSGAALMHGTSTMCGLSEYAASSTTWSTRLVCIN